MARTGRRPGVSGTRERILACARSRFAADGFGGATIRAIAADAGVDPALVHHYFGTKRDLLGEVLAFPVGPDHLRAVLTETPTDELGQAIVRTFLDVWDTPEHAERLRILLRTAVADDAVAAMVREFVVGALLGPVAASLDVEDRELRVTLVASQLVGFAFLRYLLRMEPLASADHDAVVAAYAPTVQRYLTGVLP